MRHRMNRYKARKSFNRATTRTKAINMAPKPMRGGYRL
ncbi:MAG: hypothetical protein [Microvirus sp.]|nr:MAG: hypothetical protein [Microvirus sp.]